MGSPPPQHDPEDPDDELVRAAVAGDPNAIERLLRNDYSRLYTLCRRICSSREQAEDATQNTLIAIVRGLPAFDGRSRFSTWSHRIASNAAIDELRRARRRRVDALEHDPSSRHPTAAVHLEDPETGSRAIGRTGPEPGPESLVVGAETRRRLSAALDRLDERYRVPMVLRDVAQFDYAEIAELLDLPPGTVRSRISRGRSALRDMLRGTDLYPDEPVEDGNRGGPLDVETERR